MTHSLLLNVDRYDDTCQFEINQIFLQESDQKRLRIPLVSHMMLFFEVLCARTWICSLKEQFHFLPWKLVFCLWFLAMWLLRYAEKGASWSMNGAFKSFFRMKIRCGGVKRFLKQNISSFLSLTRLTLSPDLSTICNNQFYQSFLSRFVAVLFIGSLDQDEIHR